MLPFPFCFQQYYGSTHKKEKGSKHTRWSITSFPSCLANLTLKHPKGLKSRKPSNHQSRRFYAEISSYPIQTLHEFRSPASRKTSGILQEFLLALLKHSLSKQNNHEESKKNKAIQIFCLRENKDSISDPCLTCRGNKGTGLTNIGGFLTPGGYHMPMKANCIKQLEVCLLLKAAKQIGNTWETKRGSAIQTLTRFNLACWEDG